MRAERVGRETLLSQIVDMVGQAQRSRAPIDRLADTVASYFVPAVLAIAVVNVGSLFVLRADDRRDVFTIRAALGGISIRAMPAST